MAKKTLSKPPKPPRKRETVIPSGRGVGEYHSESGEKK